VFILARYFAYGDLVRGWGSLVSVTLILGGVQLAFIGLIGEYLARIFEQSKGRPLYILKQQPDAQPTMAVAGDARALPR
jgi:polyisoprenyl-phosphate glycosyltransferase